MRLFENYLEPLREVGIESIARDARVDEYSKKLKDKIGEQVKETWEREKDKPPRERKLITFVSDGFEGYKIGFAHCFHCKACVWRFNWQ